MSERMKGEGNHRHGKRPHNFLGRTQHGDGYILIHSPDHPFGGVHKTVMEHRLVMEAHLRECEPSSRWLVKVDGDLYLDPSGEVHHVDGDKANNAIDNLEVMSKADHARIHLLGDC